MKIVESIDQVVGVIRPGQRVFIHGAAATPTKLINALYERRKSLKGVELIHIHLEGPLPFIEKDFKDSFRSTSLFVGSNLREHLDYNTLDYLPIFLSEIPRLFRNGIRKPDVAIIHVSPPDEKGFCSLGTSVDVAKAACDASDVIIAQINPLMPYVLGDGLIHINDIDVAIEISSALHEIKAPEVSSIEKQIGHHIATHIEDGSTLQLGIGKIPNAILSNLSNHKHLGIHTEVWSDTLLPLIHSGVIDNSCKVIHRGKIVSSFILGSKKTYDFIHNNPDVLNLDAGFTNNPQNIALNPKVVAINSAVEIDLTGQVCADSIGANIISGVGGQIDYMRGASLAKDGKAVIAIPSRTLDGSPKICARLKPSAGVVTTRADVHYVATEYGITDLHGKTLHERAKALINLAHPNDREELEKQWAQRKNHLL